MRLSLVLLAASLSACGPDLSAWKGTWSGNAAVNTGRQPEVVPASFTFAEGATANFGLGPWGSPARTFTCTLVALEADPAKATFTPHAACAVEKSAGDDCAYGLLFNTGSAQRTGESLDAALSGRLTTTCPSGSSAVDLGVQLTATRK